MADSSCQYVKRAKHDRHSLALVVANTDAIEINVTQLKTDYKARSQAAAAMFGELCRSTATRTEEQE
jgi:hypothetical protein